MSEKDKNFFDNIILCLKFVGLLKFNNKKIKFFYDIIILFIFTFDFLLIIFDIVYMLTTNDNFKDILTKNFYMFATHCSGFFKACNFLMNKKKILNIIIKCHKKYIYKPYNSEEQKLFDDRKKFSW